MANDTEGATEAGDGEGAAAPGAGGGASRDGERKGSGVVSLLPAPEDREALRALEALIFASSEPVDEATLARQLDPDCNVPELLAGLQRLYEPRGVNLVKRGRGWAFRTAPDLAHLMVRHTVEQRRLSRAALETLAIIAYHQPVTRAEVEEIRGHATSKGTLDVLLELDWVRMRGRRRAPGRPVTYGTTERFLDQFALESLKDLPGLNELKGAGLLDSRLPPGFTVPEPDGLEGLADNEDPLEDDGIGEPELELDPIGDDDEAEPEAEDGDATGGTAAGNARPPGDERSS
ncbi:MAG: SMC-Scp complex subunit ScpB [Rhizobiales bacterium]|nr:SMC-Scp complex subunit ScpB [Hyphomicrobiales bacterium]